MCKTNEHSCNCKGCKCSSDGFFQLPKDFRSVVEDILIIGMGQLDVVDVIDSSKGKTVNLSLGSDEKISVMISDLGARDKKASKICYYDLTLKHQAKEVGIDNLEIPSEVDRLAKMLENLGYVFEYVSQSTSRENVPGYQLTYNHIRFVCGAEITCQVAQRDVQVEIVYEIKREQIPQKWEPMGPCGFGC